MRARAGLVTVGSIEGGFGHDPRTDVDSFGPWGGILSKYTCDGQDVSPPLAWSSVPAEAKSLLLIIDDPDAPDPAAPKMTWVHWVLYNIPPSASALPEAARQLPAGTLDGVNDWKRTGYSGPCPPIGRHRYFHKLYALDILLQRRSLRHRSRATLLSWDLPEAQVSAMLRLIQPAAEFISRWHLNARGLGML